MYADPTMQSFQGAMPVTADAAVLDVPTAVADPDLALAILYLAPQPCEALEALIALPTR